MKAHSYGFSRIAFLLGSASLALGTTAVHAGNGGTGGFYLTTDVGVNLANDRVSESSFGSGSESVSLNPGVRWDLSAGYNFKLSNHLTLAPELEVGYMYNSFDKGTAGGQNTSGGGSLSQVPVLANAVLSWQFNSKWSACAGFGIGLDDFDVSVSNGSILSDLATTDGCIAWQGTAGIQYQFGSSEVGVGYKYLDCTGPLFYDNVGNSAIMASYTYHF